MYMPSILDIFQIYRGSCSYGDQKPVKEAK